MTEPSAKPSPQVLSFANFYNGNFTDLSIECQGYTFAAHKVILANHSIVFEKMLSGDWKEARDGVINLDETKFPVVDAMVYFIYHLNYDGGRYLDARPNDMIFHIQVYTVADAYDMPHLRNHSRSRFKAALMEGACQTDNFFSVVREVYAATPDADRTLRDIVVEVSQAHAENLVQRADFQSGLKQTPDFMFDLLRGLAVWGPVAFAFTPNEVVRGLFKCPNCDMAGVVLYPKNSRPDSRPICCEECNQWMEAVEPK